MKKEVQFLLAQINPMMGAIEENAQKMIDIISHSVEDVIVFPELALTGYPPQDILYHADCDFRVQKALALMAKAVKTSFVLVGHPVMFEGHCYNAASILHQGQVMAVYFKQHLPNYGVFDEKRYFSPGPKKPCVFEVHGKKIGVCICEDIWHEGPFEDLAQENVALILVMNASPFDQDKVEERTQLLRKKVSPGVAVIYLNLVGVQDELVFDGASFVMNAAGEIVARAPSFKTALLKVIWQGQNLQGPITPELSKDAQMYEALVLSIRDYVQKNGFQRVILGLSGGVDSALVLCLAVDALGASKVEAVLLPSPYTAAMSNDDAYLLAKNLNVKTLTIPIHAPFETFLELLMPHFENQSADVTEQNMQARIRGLILMALSNKHHSLLLSTSNKSEAAVGYATLYGDMCGAYSPLKDVLKTEVYRLCAYRNTIQNVIPNRILTRAPSAELAPNQKDQDTLPPYDILDAILTQYMEQRASPQALIQNGYDKNTVERVISLIKRNEYKRAQASPGPKISKVAFGLDWRYPLTSKF